MNFYQKAVIAAGTLLVALRLAFPVKYTEILGMRFKASEDMGMFQNVDWTAMGLHIGGILVVTVALALILGRGK